MEQQLRLLKLFTLLIFVLSHSALEAQDKPISRKIEGVLVYQYRPEKGETVTLYKKNGAILKKLTVNDYLSRDAVISPFAMKGENFLLVFDCIGLTDKEYIIIVKDENGLLGYIKKSDPHFKFETWPQHIVHVVTVDFDAASNPLHSSPDPKSSRIKCKPGEFFFPKLVKGNWLRVSWDGPKPDKGWIKWRDSKHNLLVDVFYDM